MLNNNLSPRVSVQIVSATGFIPEPPADAQLVNTSVYL